MRSDACLSAGERRDQPFFRRAVALLRRWRVGRTYRRAIYRYMFFHATLDAFAAGYSASACAARRVFVGAP